MARQLTVLLVLLAGLCASAVAANVAYYGVTVAGVTADTNSGSQDITVTNPAHFEEDMLISVVGAQGISRVLSVNGNILHVDTAQDVTLRGATIRIIGDGLDHTSIRLWLTADTNTFASFWFDVSPHTSGPQYRYRTGETNANSGPVAAVAVVGLNPNTTYYFRGNVKTVYGNDNSSACNTDACGAREFSFTTPADPHSSNGRPPMPTLPEPVAAHLLAAPNTTGYQTVRVPEFDDGLVTGTIAAGSLSTLTVNTVPSGMQSGQWIVITGVTCPNNWLGNPQPPWCRIQSINGTNITLATPASAAVTNAAVSWGAFNIFQYITDGKRYGTIYEWQQGYKAKWWGTDFGFSQQGLKIPGLPVDANPACAIPSACSMDDPNHRWIIFRTKSSPKTLPPPGTRIGPDFEAALGGVVSQDTSGCFVIPGADANPVHHLRFENLECTSLPSPIDAVDPAPGGLAFSFSPGQGNKLAQYLLFDRVYIHTPDKYTRATKYFSFFSARQAAVINSYLKGDYWRPYRLHYGPDINTDQPTTFSSGAIQLKGVQWQRNKFEPMWSAGAATVTPSGTASATVTILGYLTSSGLNVQYTSGRGVTLSCSGAGGCYSLTGVAAPETPYNARLVFKAVVNSGQSAIQCSTFCYWDGSQVDMADSVWLTEGAIGVYPGDGDHWLFENNYFEVYGTGQWYIDIPTGLIARPPRHVTIRRNRFYWNQDRRLTSPTTNGFWYQVRHNAIELKRGQLFLIEGNEMSGGWARINHGGPVALSNTASVFLQPIVTGIYDITFRYNMLYTQAEGFGGGGHEFNNFLMARDSARIYWGHNLVYDQNGFVQNERPSPGFFGKQGSFIGHDTIVEHNTWYDSRGNLPVFFAAGGDRMEGMWFQNNMWHLNRDGFYGMLFQTIDNGTLLMVPPVQQTGTWDQQFASVSVRLAETVMPNVTFSHNVITCGVVAHSATDVTDITQSECDTYKAQFGSWANINYFPIGSTRKAREQAVKWNNPDRRDFRLNVSSQFASGGQKSSDGFDAGVDALELRRRLGVISDIFARNITRNAATIHAKIPDTQMSCSAAYGKDADPTLWTIGAPVSSGGSERLLDLAGLESGTTYNYQVWCAGIPRSVTHQFTTSM